jgi:hypothetical protein
MPKESSMKRRRRAGAALFGGLTAALLVSAAFGGAASAAPAWKFGVKTLEGTETISGVAIESAMTFPGLTTKCEQLLYKMKISNGGSTGKGEITELSFKNCSTNSPACSVESIGAKNLPWPLHLTKVVTSNYVVVEQVKVTIAYAGEECPLGETVATITGSAGGVFDNLNSTISFSPTSFKATGTELRALGMAIEWNAFFSTEATGPHAGQALEVG